MDTGIVFEVFLEEFQKIGGVIIIIKWKYDTECKSEVNQCNVCSNKTVFLI